MQDSLYKKYFTDGMHKYRIIEKLANIVKVILTCHEFPTCSQFNT